MLRTRTTLLLASLVLFGLGIVVFSSFVDVFYSALCLFFFPLLVALAGVSLISDFSRTSKGVEPAVRTVTARSHNPFDLSHAA